MTSRKGGQTVSTASGDRFEPKAAAKLGRELARALPYSHEMGCIHRDLKPGNILIREDGRPVIIDFGLAKTIDSGVVTTRSGTIMGTPVYMSPEQARGSSHQADAPTDVYALGVIFIRCSIGSRPIHTNWTRGFQAAWETFAANASRKRRPTDTIQRTLWPQI